MGKISFGYDMKSGFLLGWLGLRQKSLSGVGSGSRLGQVQVGLGGLRRIPYLGAVGFAGLGQLGYPS
jgi:hypothetical protein